MAALFIVVVPLTFSEYYVSILNLVLIAVVGALGLNILVGYTGQISIGHGAFMSVGAYTAANLVVRLGMPVLDHAAGRRADGGADRRDRRHPVVAHQGHLSGDRHAGGAADHRMDDQPRASGSRAACRPRSRCRGRSLFGIALKHASADLFVPDVLRRAGARRDPQPGAQPHRPRLRRDPRPGHRRRDHRHQHLPLQALCLCDLVVLCRASPACSKPIISASPITSSSRSTSRSTIWR